MYHSPPPHISFANASIDVRDRPTGARMSTASIGPYNRGSCVRKSYEECCYSNLSFCFNGLLATRSISDITASSSLPVSATSSTPTSKASQIILPVSSEGEISNINLLVSTLCDDASFRMFPSDEFYPRSHIGAAALSQDVPVAIQDA